MSTNPIRFFVCHDLSDALKITNEYQENGAQSAIWFASKLSTDKKCLVFNGFHILFQRIDVEAEIAEGTIIVGLVSVFRRDYKERLNTYEEMEKVYGIFQHVTVLRKGEGPKVLI